MTDDPTAFPAEEPTTQRKPVPERFQVSRSTLFLDRFMTVAIQAGGIGIIITVFAIFAFIGWEVLPLFGKAKVHPARTLAIPEDLRDARVLGVDDWGGLPFLYDGGQEIAFLRLAEDGSTQVERMPLGLPEGTEVTAVSYNQRRQRLILGTALGQFMVVDIQYTSTGGVGDEPRVVKATLKESTPLTPIGQPNSPIRSIGYGDGGARKIVGALQQDGDTWRLHALTLKQKRGLMGSGKIERDTEFDLSEHLTGKPENLLVSGNGDSLLISEDDGDILYFYEEGSGLVLRQRFKPFDDGENVRVASMNYIFGDVSISLTSQAGENKIFSLYRPSEKENRRMFGHTKTLPDMDQGSDFYASSLRNKAYLTGHGNFASVRYTTTESVRWEKELPFSVRQAVFDPKYEHILFLSDAGNLEIYELHDPHPEAGWKAFFGKIWYEGASEPAHVWQSTSGTDDFEPKLSLTPLILGSLKGTFYALLFAVPIALCAAVYVSNFMEPRYKKIIKPTLEIMASLPSVVLGFLAALWLAPLVDQRVPSVILICFGLPLVTLAFGWFWTHQPMAIRSKLRPGQEFILLLPIMLVAGYVFWNLGPVMESIFFVVKDPVTGKEVADFRLWWPHVTNTPYSQRNSMVVGFMMGFAVIPVIFTIAEDSLSNVPPSLTAASSALGASRWQTVRHVVLPIASAGIFSALMIGLGRAVGETMIVVMATGNTPVMDFNIFSGMRTLSANVAVELPEAPPGSTHYRTLFLGAMALFLMTFALNTVAEVLRQHLREKFKLI